MSSEYNRLARSLYESLIWEHERRMDRVREPDRSRSSTLATIRSPDDGADPNLGDLGAIITKEAIENAPLCGVGAYGRVYAITHERLGRVAVKRIHESGGQCEVDAVRMRARREGETWMRLKHPHILQLLGIIESKTAFHFVMPYQRNGSLRAYLQSNQTFDKRQALVECADGVSYLHAHNIIHGDLKAANVLVADDFRMLICDFGLSRLVDLTTSTGLKGVGSTRWMSPELLEEGGKKSFATDVWAFGMVAYEILSGLVPFHRLNSIPLIALNIAQHKMPPHIPTHGEDGQPYADLWATVEQCHDTDPQLRPAMTVIHRRIRDPSGSHP